MRIDPLDFDFAGRSTGRPHQWLLLAVAAALLVATGVVGWRQHAQIDDLHSTTVRAQQRAERQRPAPVVRGGIPVVRAGIIERELLRPWPALLAAIETISDARIRLLEIEPDSRSGRVLLTGQAASFDALAEYLARLNGTALDDLWLQSHQQAPDLPDKPIRFTVSARWDEPLQVRPGTGAAVR